MTTPDHTQPSHPPRGQRHSPRPPRPRPFRGPGPVPGVTDDDAVGRRRPTMRVRDESDLLALIPYTFGFHPEESLVMMVLGRGGSPMFARVDMPTSVAEADDVCAELLHAVRVNGGRRAALVAYTADETAAFLAAEQASDELADNGVEVMLAMRADDGRWWHLLPQHAGDGAPYDVSSHPITASGVLEGRVTHASRRRLAESLLPADLDVVDAVAAAADAQPRLASDRASLVHEARWLRAWVDERVRDGGAAHDVAVDELVRVIRALAHVELRDVAWACMTRRNADQHVRLWTDVVVRCPLERLAPAAGLLAFAAWLSGHGALSWCAVDRALASDPDHTLAQLVAQTLDAAMPPSAWQGVDPGSVSLLQG